MCGILGQINIRNNFASALPLDKISHRGPDGEGEWINISGNVYLGHTRLAILEPTQAGQQPMTDSSKKYTIIFNGEIYNHLELRRELPNINWRGNSDTETLLELLALKGIEALPLLKGMFAFALHNAEDSSILLVRDRLGIKPLWYRGDNENISFSSEVRPLLEPGDFQLNVNAFSEYIGFGHLPNSGEIFNGIYSLPPGSWMKIWSNGESKKTIWWPKDKFQTLKSGSKQEYVKRVNSLVTTAIEEHLISDVGVGAFLSGGIDSSIVALVAGKVLGNNLQTFTVGFPQSSFDERLIARKVAKKLGSEHWELEIKEDECLNLVKEAVLNMDLPSVDAINTFIVSKAVRDKGLKVALSGLGGDELFGGYPAFSQVPPLHLLKSLPNNVRMALIEIMPGNLKEKLSGLNSFNITELTVSRRRFTSITTLKDLGLKEGMPIIPPQPDGIDMMGKISWAELHGYTIPMLLRDSDQMSMAVGLEIRVPFLDHHLVEEVLGFPQKFKKGQGVKPLLVEAFRSELPKEVFNRPKQGFSLPMDEWMRGPLNTFTLEGVNSAGNLLNSYEPLDQWTKFLNKQLHWTRVWNWCVLGHWLTNQNVLKEKLQTQMY